MYLLHLQMTLHSPSFSRMSFITWNHNSCKPVTIKVNLLTDQTTFLCYQTRSARGMMIMMIMMAENSENNVPASSSHVCLQRLPPIRHPIIIKSRICLGNPDVLTWCLGRGEMFFHPEIIENGRFPKWTCRGRSELCRRKRSVYNIV